MFWVSKNDSSKPKQEFYSYELPFRLLSGVISHPFGAFPIIIIVPQIQTTGSLRKVGKINTKFIPTWVKKLVSEGSSSGQRRINWAWKKWKRKTQIYS